MAYLILKSTLEYPQKYGKILIEDVRKWAGWVFQESKKEIGKFYPEDELNFGYDLFLRVAQAVSESLPSFNYEKRAIELFLKEISSEKNTNNGSKKFQQLELAI